MRVIKASYEILTPISDGGIEELKHIEKIGRVCYKSEDKITEDGESAKRFVGMLIKNGHEAMIEHSSLSVKFIVDRGVSHELVRHRIASFAQESTRYCDYVNGKFGGECTFIDPTECVVRFPTKKLMSLPSSKLLDIFSEWLAAMQDAEKHYIKMRELGAPPEIARGVLPSSTKTEITVTANYREWRNFFKLRTAHDAHPQMREVAVPLLMELQTRIPIIFDDIRADDSIYIPESDNK